MNNMTIDRALELRLTSSSPPIARLALHQWLQLAADNRRADHVDALLKLLQSSNFPHKNRTLACHALADLALHLLSHANDSFVRQVILSLVPCFANLAAFWASDLAALEAAVTSLVHVYLALPDTLATALPNHPLLATLQASTASESFLWACLSHAIRTAWSDDSSKNTLHLARTLDRALPVATHLALWPNATRTTGTTIVPRRFTIPLSELGRFFVDLILHYDNPDEQDGSTAQPRLDHQLRIMDMLAHWTMCLAPTPAEADPAHMMWLSFLVDSYTAHAPTAPTDASLHWGARLADMCMLDAAQRKWRAMDTMRSVTHFLALTRSSPDRKLLVAQLEPARILPSCAFLLLDCTLDDAHTMGLIAICTRLVVTGPAHQSLACMLIIPLLQLQTHPDAAVSSAAAALLHRVASTTPADSIPSPDHDHPFLTALLDRSSALDPCLPFRILHVPYTLLTDPPAGLARLLATPLATLDTHAHHVFPLILYALSTHSTHPELVLGLVQDVLPRVIATRNAMLAAKALALLLAWAKDPLARPALAAAALVALFKAWHAWPRTYPTVREALLHYVSVMGTARRQRAGVGKAHAELEVVVAALVHEAVRDAEHIFGSADDAALVVARLVDVPQLQVRTQRVLVDACVHGVKRGLFDGDGIWALVLEEFAARYVGNKARVHLGGDEIAVLDALVAFVPLLRSEALRQQVIEQFIYPYLPFPSLVVDHVDILTQDDGMQMEMPVFKPKSASPSQEQVIFAAHAMAAMPASDRQRWIVDGARDTYSLVAEGMAREGQSERGVKAFQALLRAMIQDEAETLPRSLFFGKAADPAGATSAAADGTVSNVKAAMRAARDALATLCKTAPSIVSNAALVSNLPLSDSFQELEHIITLGTFDHHLLTRHLAIPFYMRQFTTFAPHKRPETDRLLFFNSLVQVYMSAEFPIAKGHALLAMTAFALALHGLRDDSASEFSDFCFALILHQYAGVDWKRSEAASVGVSQADFKALLGLQSVNTESDELLAAVAQCLGHLSSVSGDEETWDAAVSYLVGDLDKASDWAGYSRATAICMILGNRYTTRANPPAFQVQVQSFLQEHGHEQLAFLPIKTAIGLAMGISFIVRTKPTALPDTIVTYALSAIDDFAQDAAVPLRAACAAWILLHHPQGQDRLRKLFVHLPGFTDVADLNIRSHLMLVVSRASVLADPDTLQAQVKGHMTGWTQPGQAPLARLNHVVALFSTLGFDFVNPDLSSTAVHEMLLANRFMPTILDLAGAGAHGTAKFNAAMSRVAKVAIPLLSWTVAKWCAQESSAQQPQTMVGEPANLAHMDRETSVVRNAFDDLSTANQQPGFLAAVLQALAVPEALPMVDWYPLLDDARHKGLSQTAWQFAAVRAPSSYSAVRYLLENLLARTKSALEWRLAVSQQGVGVLMALAGIEKVTTEKRGRKGAIVTVSEDKLIDVVRVLVQGLFHSEAVVAEFGVDQVGVWRTQFLETVAAQVPDAPPIDGAYARLSRFMLEFLDLLPDLSMAQQRILVQHFVYTYSAPESLASGILTGRTLEQAISVTAHLVGLVAQRRSTAPLPQHLSENALLSTALHAAQGLRAARRAELNALLLSTILQLIERNSLPDPKEPLSTAERTQWIARVHHQETADWVIRLLDLVLVLQSTNRQDSSPVSEQVLSFFVLGVLNSQGPPHEDNGMVNGSSWAARLAVELEALVGHGSGIGLAIKVMKRVLLMLPRVDEPSRRALVAFVAPYRLVDEKSWRVWSDHQV